MKHTDGIIIQARTGSTRMPRKILLPFSGEQSILDILIGRIRQSCPELPLIVATTDNAGDDVIAAAAARSGALVSRGSENDVLDRFIKAADEHNLTRIIRVCSDNPFLRTDTFRTLLDASDANPLADYVAYAYPGGRPTIKSHIGLYAECVTVDALRQAALSPDAVDHEHVTIHIYTHPDRFRTAYLPLPEIIRSRDDIRLTIDTPDDFALLTEIYSRYTGGTDGTVEALVALADSDPRYGRIMKQNISRNSK